MRRVAAVDVGTNTALLVIAEFVQGVLVPIVEAERFVRLGAGVDRDGFVSAEAIMRLETVLAEFRSTADRHGATEGLVGATSASRDAANRDELIARAQAACGWPYRVLSGTEEAGLTFAAAASEVQTGARRRVTVLDVGGGSAELVTGYAGPPAQVTAERSVDVGSVRISERFFGRVPASAEAIRAATGFVDEALGPAARAVGRTRVLLGVGGTATTLAGLAGSAEVTFDEVVAWRDRLLAMDAASVLALDPRLLSGREDVIAAGVLIVAAAMRVVGARHFRATRRGLRHGLALRAFGAL